MVELRHISGRLRPHALSAVFGLCVVTLMVIWAVHNGGYDNETWYWGALVVLALVAGATVGFGGRLRLGRAGRVALLLFAAYVAWSYLSISWAQSPGDTLEGSNRALFYLLVFTLMAVLPWTAEAMLGALVVFAIGVGTIAVVLLARLASADHVAALIVGGRLASPTGYINSTAALFTMDALVSIALATRRELPGLLRGLLLALAGAALQLAVMVQSRGWLFTLPLVVLLAVVVLKDRIRFAVAAVIPVLVTVIPVRKFLAIYDNAHGNQLGHASAHAGQLGLLLLAGAFVFGTLLAWADQLVRPPRPRRSRVLAVGAVTAAIGVGGLVAGALVVSHGRPFHYISREWHGFSHQQNASSGSHFTDVGSGRYDFWRVALDAFAANPTGGLGQDNFADYYVKRRRTYEEPQWVHSFELRLLAHTGIVGFLLFGGFLVFALLAAARARRRAPMLLQAAVGIGLLPVVVWLIHGSVDWFWEVPALAGPALGFLGMASGAETIAATEEHRVGVLARASSAVPRWSVAAGGVVAFLAAVLVLGFPYLSAREVSLATDVRDPIAALADLKRAADLNPLSADPARLAGAIALENGQYAIAEQRFRQAIDREPGGWFSWLGAGIAASALGKPEQAHQDFAMAYSINSQQPAVIQALHRVFTKNPLTSAEAFKLFIVTQ